MNKYPTLFKVGDSVRFERKGLNYTGIIKQVNRETVIVRTTCLPPFKEQLFRLFQTQVEPLHNNKPQVRFVVCLTRTVDQRDTVYGPFDTDKEAKEWLAERGFQDEPVAYWTHRILELTPELDKGHLDEIAEFRKANGYA